MIADIVAIVEFIEIVEILKNVDIVPHSLYACNATRQC